MERTCRVQLLSLEQVVQALNLTVDRVEHLVATGQLPAIIIEGERRFVETDLVPLIQTYKQVQERSRNAQP